MKLEQAVIECATAYAVANGYSASDRTAVGLVLAGMAIMACCTTEVQERMLTSYLEQLPAAVAPLDKWAASLEAAA